MAVKVERRVVCDFGERHGGEIRQWRITVDRESKVFDLCPACSRPLTTIWARGADAAGQAKLQVVTLTEIEARKQGQTPHP